MTAMQWYSYKLERLVFHYNRYDWHFYFFLLPLVGYYLLTGFYALLGVIFYAACLVVWQRKIDKKLVFTARVKRFFLFLLLALTFQNLLCLALLACSKFSVLLPLLVAHVLSIAYEKMLFEGFKKAARQKLEHNPNLKIVAITASYGKTSIKNFLAHLLEASFHVYKTPRSVNTLGGIIKDINEALPEQCDVYIVEAGARLQGDIDEIARFVNPHIAVVGSIGPQHLEYFKTLENIRNTKMELLHSVRLEKAFVHESAHAIGNEKVTIFGSELRNVQATLEGLSFDMELDGKSEHFTCKLLGAFNAINIAAAIHVAHALGLGVETIRQGVSSLQGVEHRLQRIDAGGKLIIDDSFNGNLEGMLSSYDLVKTHQGRKVIITPGIVESTEDANKALAEKIDSIFDLVIITGKTNAKILDTHIQKAEKIVLGDKSQLQEILASQTFAGDVVLFSNDAPSFI
jgi:UDP-N-acetylmuramoyl-tripeptide--D-alanyl-D-alanine ligase